MTVRQLPSSGFGTSGGWIWRKCCFTEWCPTWTINNRLQLDPWTELAVFCLALLHQKYLWGLI
jgi:hypothetical protein